MAKRIAIAAVGLNSTEMLGHPVMEINNFTEGAISTALQQGTAIRWLFMGTTRTAIG